MNEKVALKNINQAKSTFVAVTGTALLMANPPRPIKANCSICFRQFQTASNGAPDSDESVSSFGTTQLNSLLVCVIEAYQVSKVIFTVKVAQKIYCMHDRVRKVQVSFCFDELIDRFASSVPQ